MTREQELILLLEKASDAYYNGQTPILDDQTFDTLRNELESLNPSSPFLSKVGAPPRGSTVRLPYLMASLTKIKPANGTVEKFAETGSSFLLSDKLDGLSALWCSTTRKLYLRGNGEQGVDISSFVPYIQCLRTSNPCIVRGELICAGESRSWVNGILHQKELSVADAKKIRFIAYELLEPKGYKRSYQFTVLEEYGFALPWNDLVEKNSLTQEKLSQIFGVRRTTSTYAIDGIVVGVDCIPQSQTNPGTTVMNPKDCVAFKMVLEDQCATTTIKAILWSPSHQGYLIPRLQVDPVTVQDCQIEFLSGHNAKLICEKKLGVGATIRIRRSGDVIPTLDSVLIPSETIPFPSKYEWDSTHTHIVLPAENQGDSSEMKTAKLCHFASTLEIQFLGPGLVKKLVDAGYSGPKHLKSMTPEQWTTTLGKGMGEKVRESFLKQMNSLTELKLMIASSMLPRGTGETKLKALFQREPDWMKWSMKILAGIPHWSYVALEECLTALEEYKKWRYDNFGQLVLDASITPCQSTAVPSSSVCFTGFRSSDLEAKCKAHNIEVHLSLTKQTTVLVVSDLETSGSGKAKKARDMGIRILDRSQFEKEYLGQA